MTPGARLQAVIDILGAIASFGRPADTIVGNYVKSRRYVGSKDRRAITDQLWRVLRRRARIAWWLERQGVSAPDARLRVLADMALSDMAPRDIAELCDTPRGPAALTADERHVVEHLRGKSLFHHDMPEWVKGEYPEWVEPLLRPTLGEDFPTEMGAMRDEAPVDLRVNTLKATREQAIAALAADSVTAEPTPLSPLGLRLSARVALVEKQAFRNGLVDVQDEGSQILAQLVDARPGMAVCDFCAGAGGKTLALAAAMDNKGRLVACDVHEERLERAVERLRRAGVHNVTRRPLDSLHDKWIKRSAASFDRVLVDAPCSGSGTWRRNPDAKWRLTPAGLDEVVALQAQIMETAVRLVKPGGRLVYATCSLLPAENERQIERFLAAHPDFAPVALPDVWAATVGGQCPGAGPYLHLTPARHGTDGFFAAVMERQAG